MSAQTNPVIAIIGAGLSGLTLAKVLQTHGVSCTVYELEVSAEVRGQGGSLDMTEQSGLRALTVAGLMKEFVAIARPEGDSWKFAGHDGTMRFAQPPDEAPETSSVEQAEEAKPFPDGTRPEADRGMLRQIFLDSLAPETIKWDHKLESITPLPSATSSHKYELKFANGEIASADLVVGADGAWSRVRSLLSPAQPEYTGVTLVDLRMDRVDQDYPELGELIGAGTFLAVGDNRLLFSQRNSNSHVRTYVTLRVAEDWVETCGIPFSSDPKTTRIKLLEYYTGWAPELRRIIEVCQDEINPRPLYKLPVGLKWEHVPGVTLVGDAAHLMSPFAGEGANIAMLDGALLGLAVVSAVKSSAAWNAESLDNAVAQYEDEMYVRAKWAAALSDKHMREMVSDDGIDRVMALFAGPPPGEGTE